MYSLIISVLRSLTWWAYLGLAVLIGYWTYSGYEGLVAQQAAAERAILSGLPPQLAVGSYAPDRAANPLAEVHLRGIIRADLGIGQIGEPESGTPFIVLDDETGRGALVAVVFTGASRDAALSEFVATSDATGRVTVTGFERSLNRSDVRGQLLVRGEMREVYLVEPYLGEREQALLDRADRDLPLIYAGAAVTLMIGLTAAWRYRRWRNRVVRLRLGPAADPIGPRADRSWRQMETNRNPSSSATSPWGAPAAATPPAVPQARPDPTAIVPLVADEKTVAAMINTAPAFKSVFPGGGSAFRFKTADEIIRERFGTLSVLSKPTDTSLR